MKLSFSKKSSKSSTKKPVVFGSTDNTHERTDQITYLTQFDPSESRSAGVNGYQAAAVIPPKPNEWRPLKKMKNLELPIDSDLAASGLEKFETQPKTLGEENKDAVVTYGLTVRKNNTEKVTTIAEVGIEQEEPRAFVVSDAQRFKEEVEALGDDPGFEDMPVEGFGTALLAGYGWTEGKGIGRNAKGDVKVRQYERGAQKQGLGFKPEQHVSRKEVKERESHFGGSESRDRERNSRDRGSDSRDRKSGSSDSGRAKRPQVRIVRGSQDDLVGLKGEVVSEDNGWLILKLGNGRDEARVRVKDVVELGSKEEDRSLRMLKDLRTRKESNGRDKTKIEEMKSTRDEKSGRTGNKMGWLVSNIRVRVISKDLKRGRLYRKKGEVVDVVGPMSCDVLMDESRELIQGVNQAFLETALPKRGGPVCVLSGPHKGVHGNLVDRDLDRETGVVRDADSHEHFNVQLDQVAEFVGDPSLAGY